MSDTPEMLSAGAKWLLERWLEKFKSVIESMTEDKPVLTWAVEGNQDLGAGALILEQRFASVAEPMLWIGLPESLHQDLGGRVLAAAGLENSDREENRATCLEMVEQSLGGLTSELTQRLSREIKREATNQIDSFPGEISTVHITVTVKGKPVAEPLWLAFAPILISWIETKPAETVAATSSAREESVPAGTSVISKTFDLLLDVALPVSISFGRTQLAIKDVLKLTTGSIVELDRSVSEPVDLIINDCTIARGEVVVVEGNYGVRIQSIVSRKERLRTGGAAVAEARGRVISG